MALSKTEYSGGVGDSLHSGIVNATAHTNINSGAATVYAVQVDATENNGEDVYLPMYNSASPTVGTTEPLMSLEGYRGKVTNYTFAEGVAFGTALSVAGVQEKGGSGNTGPSGTARVKIILS